MRTISMLSLLTLFLGFTTSCRHRDAGEGPYATIVAQAVPAIERTVGLRFKRPPVLQTRSKAQVRTFVLQQVNSPRAQRELAGMEGAYKLLGLLPDTLDLRKFLTNLLAEQIVGYYDPTTKVLYVVEGASQDAVQMTVTHELVHALQDQYVNLDSVQQLEGDNDRQSAAQAVFEGQAVYEQLAVVLGGGAATFNFPGGWDRVRQIIRDNQAAMPVYSAAPLVIQETLLFPYLSGAEFIKEYKEHEHGGVPFHNMPVSTEQIMHPSAFFGTRDEPTPVSFSKLPGVTRVYDNDLGEFETRILLYQYLNNQDDAVRGARGWDGDRYVVFNTSSGAGGAASRGIAWATVWDSKVDAAEFYGQMQQVVDARKGSAPTRVGRVTTGEINGRPVVLYVDVPRGVDPGIISLTAVHIGK